ncbi:zinc dependent phospholipase C family protein [Fictibacillus fluitans]|uniref:Zinc dependent phospholipase C family protein n=1 Tax=Fictibacillus fluitans TaxID=3058422 RepID=A0ABT8HZY6_9BACL|nr:zinc dependent phospholipase C family protein [Fictibacillus sp. NE201]MDN4526331.1 zinc dependent phospholipase C family protein [Fictibacillus sp. NE201]
MLIQPISSIRKDCSDLFAYSHKVMAHHIQSHVRESVQYDLNKSMFTWANMKPDFIPELAKRKHYIEESFEFVVDKIVALLETPASDLLDKQKRRWLEIEMGVICHFVTDFFCVPHNQRWEFKHAMIPHVKYERALDKKARMLNSINCLTLPEIKEYSKESVSFFLDELLYEYEQKKDYKRDMVYSISVCSAICTFILEKIYLNDFGKTA